MIRQRVLLVACLLLCGMGVAARGDLPDDLAELEQLRNGRETDFAPVEKMGQELLAKYTTPDEQGKIFFRLAHIYAQSGLMQPQRGIALCEEALKCPLSPNDRLTMFVYIGDSYMGGNWGDRGTFPERRKKAFASYLTGLKEVRKMKLPAEKPLHRSRPPDDHEAATPAGRARYAKVYDAWEKAQTERQLIVQREVLTQQATTAYLYKPYDTAEMRAELAPLLDDKPLEREIISVVEAKVPVPPAALLAKDSAARARRFWWLLIGNAVVVVVLAIYVVRRRFATRKGVA